MTRSSYARRMYRAPSVWDKIVAGIGVIFLIVVSVVIKTAIAMVGLWMILDWGFEIVMPFGNLLAIAVGASILMTGITESKS